MLKKDISISEEEWEEYQEFIKEYYKKKKEKQEKSLLYWLYCRVKGE